MPFLDKKFLEVAMNIDPKEKAFTKGAGQEIDEDGCPKMEKVLRLLKALNPFLFMIVSLVHPEKSL